MSHLAEFNEAEAWRRFKAGDAHAFERLIQTYYQDLLNYGNKFGMGEELVKDCIQDVFLTLWSNRATVSDTSFVKYYLLKSLRRTLSRAHKKNFRYTSLEGLSFENIFEQELPAEARLIASETVTQLSLKMREVLKTLSKRQQEIIYLRFYLDATLEEIAEIMSLKQQSVYNLLHDALKRLKAKSDLSHLLSTTLLLFAFGLAAV